MRREQILLLLGAISDVHYLCLLYVGIFCGPRASDVIGMQWKSWNGESLTPHSTAFEGKLYVDRFKTTQSKAPIPLTALMFPAFGRGKRKGQAVPAGEGTFLTWSVRPIGRKLGIPDHLITF
jgi:hypothetical protein